MAERIRIIADCDALRSPNPQGDRLVRLGAGSELPLLRDDDVDYYKVAYGGQPVFVAKSHCIRVEADMGGETASTVVPPAGQSAGMPAAAMRAAPTPAVRRRVRASRGGNGSLMVGRVFVLVIGAVLAAGGAGMITGAAHTVLAPESSVGSGYGIGIGGGVMLALGLVLVRVTFRPLLQLALILGGIALAIGGTELLVSAIAYSRMSAGDIDPDRAQTALPIAGGMLLALGVATALIALLRWLRNPESRACWPDVARWGAIIYGGLLALGGVTIAGIITAVAMFGEGQTPTTQDAAATGLLIPLALLPGALLGYHGLTTTQRSEGPPFRFLPAAALAALFALAVGLGAIVVAVGEPVVWLMSGAHAGAALLPAVALIALASSGGLRLGAPLAGLSHRHVWVALAVGMAVVTTVAGSLNGLVGGSLATALLAADGAFDGLRSIDEATEMMWDVFLATDLYLSRGKAIILSITVLVIMAPILEEGLKGFGVALVLPRRSTPAAALTLGVAVGTGFGVYEASLYGLAVLDPDAPSEWWAFMLIRGGATTMHALNTGLLGLALYYDRSEGRLRRAFMLYVAAVGLHGLWNGLAVLAGMRLIFEFENLTERELAWLAYGVLAVLSIALIGTLYAVARRAYSVSPKVGDSEEPASPPSPLPTFEPWLG